MKVAIVNAHILDSLGGSEMQCDLIAQGLLRKGHEVIYASVGKNKLTKYIGVNYPVEPLNLLDVEQIRFFFKKHRPDVIYWRYNKRNFPNIIKVKQGFNIPLVFAVSSKRDTQRFAYAQKKGMNAFRKVLYYLKHMMSSAIAYHYIKKVDAVTVLNSQYLNILPVKKQATIWNAASLSKETFSWPKPFVLWVANLKAIKRPEIFVKLAEKFCERNSNLDFIMIGDIQEEIPYRYTISKAEEAENFHFLGKQSPEFVNGVLSEAMCLVHTCKPEGFGNNFIQAWLQGCPTITLDHDPDGLIEKEKLGFVSKEFSQMCIDLDKMVSKPEVRKAMSEKALHFSHRYFTPECLTERIESFLEEIIRESTVKSNV